MYKALVTCEPMAQTVWIWNTKGVGVYVERRKREETGQRKENEKEGFQLQRTVSATVG